MGSNDQCLSEFVLDHVGDDALQAGNYRGVKSLVESKRELTEGFSSGFSGIASAIHSAGQAIGGLRGLIHYRIYGEGTRSDVPGDKGMDDSTKREAKKLDQDLQAMNKELEKIAAKARDMTKRAKKIDSVMRYI